MTPCYTRHETAPGTHVDIPHEHETEGTSMSENHHALAAGSILSSDKAWAVGWETADAQHIAAHAEAQVEATLAVAYEQRTANLIAMYADGASGPVPDIDYAALMKQIIERLGLA